MTTYMSGTCCKRRGNECGGLSGLSAEETDDEDGVLLARYSRDEMKCNLTCHKIEA
jgi:hypothetical protein